MTKLFLSCLLVWSAAASGVEPLEGRDCLSLILELRNSINLRLPLPSVREHWKRRQVEPQSVVAAVEFNDFLPPGPLANAVSRVDNGVWFEDGQRVRRISPKQNPQAFAVLGRVFSAQAKARIASRLVGYVIDSEGDKVGEIVLDFEEDEEEVAPFAEQAFNVYRAYFPSESTKLHFHLYYAVGWFDIWLDDGHARITRVTPSIMNTARDLAGEYGTFAFSAVSPNGYAFTAAYARNGTHAVHRVIGDAVWLR